MEVFTYMKKAMLVVLVVFAFAGFMMAQNWVSPVDVLGAHNNNGRGCAGCHAPHSGAYGAGQTVKSGTDTGSYALWGQDASPLYGVSIAFGDSGKYTEVLPSTITGGGTEVGGILLCLSCHDGNVTAHNMMANQSWEQKVGLLTNTAYGTSPIPTLLGNDGTTAGNYNNDHPVGQLATISTGNGLVFNGTSMSVTPGSQYAQYVANYGYPALAPGKYSQPFGVTAGGKPYVVCTTCHNQHVMTVFTSSTANPIANDGGGKFYATYFFVNGPYNMNQAGDPTGKQAPSTTQFCRQCHFGESNEANNTNNITTVFQ
jgi:hypothetical protein